MKKVDIIKSYYEPNMGKGFPDYRVLGWESEEAQHMRFDILIDNMQLQGKKLLDVGCGMANLYDYILGKGINVKYTGIDILQSMINSASIKKPEVELICTDIFNDNPFNDNSFDLIYSSGIFNIFMGNNEEFMLNAVNLFLRLGREAVVFNLLHHKSPNKEEQYFYFSPSEVTQKLEKSFSDKIQSIDIIDSYLHNDFTVILKKANVL